MKRVFEIPIGETSIKVHDLILPRIPLPRSYHDQQGAYSCRNDTALVCGYDQSGLVQELLINEIVITLELSYSSIRGTCTATDRDIVDLDDIRGITITISGIGSRSAIV